MADADHDLIGTVGDDFILLGAGNDLAYGREGNDWINGGGGDDLLYGGDGDDTLIGGSGDDALAGGAGSDFYHFGTASGHDILIETADNSSDINGIAFEFGISPDQLFFMRHAGASNDLIIGIDGSDATLTLQDWFAADSPVRLQRMDFSYQAGSYQSVSWGAAAISAAVGADIGEPLNSAPVVAVPLVDQVVAENAGLEFAIPTGTFADIDAGDVLTFSATLANGDALPSWLSFDAGTQIFSGAPGIGNLAACVVRVTATDMAGAQATADFSLSVVAASDMALVGTAAADTLHGLSGDDTLDGGAGADTLIGGKGNDTYIVDNAKDKVVELAGEGGDSVQSSISYALAANVENLVLTGTANLGGTGNALDNQIVGNSGSNTLNGSTGADTLVGGLGNDTYYVDNVGDVVTELAGEGTDRVISSISYTLGADLENLTLTGTEAIDGTGNELNNSIVGNGAANVLSGLGGNDSLTGGASDDTLLGGEGNDSLNAGDGNDLLDGGDGNDSLTAGNGDDILIGGAGTDTLNGGAGADQMAGGADNDTYYVDNTGDIVVELAGEGTDRVISTISYTLGDNVENLTLTGTEAIDGTGNALNNSIVGNGAANVLSGLGGNDSLAGGTSDDTLLGGEGNDSLNAGDGNDLLDGGDGNDGLTAGNGDDILIGGTGNDTLNGGAGIDTMTGGTDNDTYYVDNAGDIVVELADEGTDRIISTISYTLGDNFENLTLTGTEAIDGTGNALNNSIVGNGAANVLSGLGGNDSLTGGASDDTLLGGDGNDSLNAGDGNDLLEGGAGNDSLTAGNGDDILIGGAGTDTLNGGAGIDTMTGGTDNDTYYVDDVGDVVTELAGEGTDRVISSIGYTLGADVENLTLTGMDAIDGTGNDLNNSIVGNGAANVLSGLGGNDSLTGGASDDTLLGGEGNDSLNAGDGNDLLDGGDGNDSLTAGNGDDILIGGAGTDTLNGGAGIDTMTGGADNDTYYVDNAGDVVVELAGEGTDRVISTISHTLGENVENLTLSGTEAINGFGNVLANSLAGNAAGNLLNGGDGNDSMNGAAGLDFLEGMAGNDTLTDTAGSGYFSGGAGADRLTGSAGADFFVGGTGNDILATGGGKDLIAFNRGDGYDTVSFGAAAQATVSLGGGIAYEDIRLKKSGNDLVLDAGNGEGMVFKNWYAATPVRGVANLQVMAEAMAGFDETSADPLLNAKVQDFDFQGLADAFDAARATTPGLTSWALSSALTQFHLSSSDSAALGGDLAYQYGRNGSLAGLGLTAAQEVMGDAAFGNQTQALRPLAGLQEGAVRLS
ncbi:MAG: putative Ig domain-containing protein [Sterolibacteriaceae bacterium MAG5]|nr:putative Ig domain-containing protein [Candidatus Nitricoxidireducens bremensis]